MSTLIDRDPIITIAISPHCSWQGGKAEGERIKAILAARRAIFIGFNAPNKCRLYGRYWLRDDPGSFPECSEPLEIVRPGKSQPTCDCQDKCEICGTVRRHFSVGEIAKNMGGFLFPICDSDELRLNIINLGEGI